MKNSEYNQPPFQADTLKNQRPYNYNYNLNNARTKKIRRFPVEHS